MNIEDLYDNHFVNASTNDFVDIPENCRDFIAIKTTGSALVGNLKKSSDGCWYAHENCAMNGQSYISKIDISRVCSYKYFYHDHRRRVMIDFSFGRIENISNGQRCKVSFFEDNQELEYITNCRIGYDAKNGRLYLDELGEAGYSFQLLLEMAKKATAKINQAIFAE